MTSGRYQPRAADEKWHSLKGFQHSASSTESDLHAEVCTFDWRIQCGANTTLPTLKSLMLITATNFDEL